MGMKSSNCGRSTVSKAILIGALIVSGNHATAQLRADMGYGSAMLEEAVRLYAADEKQKALEVLGTVNRNDTLYERVLQTRMEIHANLNEFEATKDLALEGIALNGSRAGTFLLMHASVLLDLKQYKEAEAAADIAAKELPGLYRPLHLKALALAGLGDKKAALTLALDNARRFPYRRDAHILLGSIAYNEGNTAEAALALAMAQMVRFEDKVAEDILVYYDAILGDRQKAEPDGYDMRVTGDDFSEELLLIKSKAAMDKKYKVKPDLTYPMARQSHLLFTLVQENKDDQGGYRSLYAPVIRAIMDQNLFEGFVYHCLASSTDPKIKAVAVKNKTKVEDFRVRIGDILRTTMILFADTIGGQELLHRFNNNGDLAAVGTGKPSDRGYIGNWTFFHPNGRRSGVGAYDAQGRMMGTWHNWFDTGVLKSQADLKEGELDGPWITYHPNGARMDSAMMRAGARTGMICTYYMSGGRHRCKTAVDNIWEGPAMEYFQTGALSWEYGMSKDKFDGMARQYYPDGALHYEGEFVAGQRVGTHRNNHPNGKPQDEFTMMEGSANGPFKKFHSNGQVYEEGTMKNDKAVGERRNYDAWGTLVLLDRLDDVGRNQGVREDYNDSGTPHIEFDYNKDLLIRYRYFDRSGKLLGEGTRTRGKFAFKGFHADGEMRVEGTYLDEGAKDGVWKYYFRDGTLESEESHDKGKMVGVAKEYDAAGALEVSKERYDRNGNEYSAIVSFYPSGAKRNEGQRKNGEQDG